MKKLKNKNDLKKAFKNESLMMHDAIDSKKYGVEKLWDDE